MRDLPFIVAQKLDGATTVASTMRIAAMAGIHVFATGGIGGVHRGAEKTFDISADMTEFAASDVAVVTAGAKAILDLALTLETLETLGVPVIGLGTDEFPAFYSRHSGHAVPMSCDNAAEVAGVMRAKWAMGLKGGVVVANPIPAEAEIPAAEIAPVIDAAVKKAEAQGIAGKETDPLPAGRDRGRDGRAARSPPTSRSSSTMPGSPRRSRSPLRRAPHERPAPRPPCRCGPHAHPPTAVEAAAASRWNPRASCPTTRSRPSTASR